MNHTGYSGKEEPVAIKPQGSEKEIVETERNFLLAMRQGLLIQLGAIEDMLSMPRSVVPKRKR